MFIPWIALPIAVTLICLYFMWRPGEDFSSGDNLGIGLFFGLVEAALRMLWLIPILAAWALYLGVAVGCLYFSK